MEKILKPASESNLLKILVLFFSYLLVVTLTNSIFVNINSTPLVEKLTFQSVVLSLSMGFSYFILTFGFLYLVIQLFEKTISQWEIFSFLAHAAFVPYLSLQAVLFAILPKPELFSNPAQVLGFFQGLCLSIIGLQVFYWLKQRLLFSTRQATTIVIFVAAVFLGIQLFFENFYQISFSFFPRR